MPLRSLFRCPIESASPMCVTLDRRTVGTVYLKSDPWPSRAAQAVGMMDGKGGPSLPRPSSFDRDGVTLQTYGTPPNAI
jgi:hypothetical protein